MQRDLNDRNYQERQNDQTTKRYNQLERCKINTNGHKMTIKRCKPGAK